jgi:adenylosuccinate lyase
MSVFPDRMMRNLELTRGLVFSPRVMLALVEAGVDRKLAYDAVQRSAMKSWDEELDFREVVKSDETVLKSLSAEQIEPLFDYGFYLRHVEHSFARLGFGTADSSDTGASS